MMSKKVLRKVLAHKKYRKRLRCPKVIVPPINTGKEFTLNYGESRA
jgi:hypothetical protein